METLADYKDLIYEQSKNMDNFMCLLMKQRNMNIKWTDEEINEIATSVKQLSASVPFLVILSIPYGFMLLPFLAMWLDRRKYLRRVCPA